MNLDNTINEIRSFRDSPVPEERLKYLNTLKWFVRTLNSLSICQEKAQEVIVSFEKAIAGYNLYPKIERFEDPIILTQLKIN